MSAKRLGAPRVQRAMMNDNAGSGRILASLWVLGVSVSSIGCASAEPRAVRHAAIEQLDCSPDAVYAVVNRTTSEVQEWYTGCDFKYLRVHCRSDGCAPAGPRPPCLGEGECFEEDPVTLKWRLVAQSTEATAPVRR